MVMEILNWMAIIGLSMVGLGLVLLAVYFIKPLKDWVMKGYDE